MRPDIRNTMLTCFEEGMAEIRLSRHQLRSNVIVSLRDTDTDIYMDAVESREECRVNKVALVNKSPDMDYVQEMFDELSMPDDILPFTVALTRSGLPRNPHINDYIIVDGRIYVVSKVRPTNRDLGRVLLLLVYPMRDERLIDDPLAIYDIRFQRNMQAVPLDDIRSAPVVLDLVYGGNPVGMSFDGETWTPFYPQFRATIPADAEALYIMDADQHVVSRAFDASASDPEPPTEEDTIRYL